MSTATSRAACLPRTLDARDFSAPLTFEGRREIAWRAKGLLLAMLLVLSATLVAAHPHPFLASEDIREGSGKLYLTRGLDELGYALVVKAVSDSQGTVVFDVNGESTPPMKEDETHYFSDGSLIIPTQITVDEDGPDLVHYYFSATDEDPKPLNLPARTQGMDSSAYVQAIQTDEGLLQGELHLSTMMEEGEPLPPAAVEDTIEQETGKQVEIPEPPALQETPEEEPSQAKTAVTVPETAPPEPAPDEPLEESQLAVPWYRRLWEWLVALIMGE